MQQGLSAPQEIARERATNWRIWHVLGLGLGVLWILDGFLQLKSSVFTSAFVRQDIAANLAGPSPLVQSIIHYGMNLWTANAIVACILAALIKFGVGPLLMMSRRYYTARGSNLSF